MAGFDVVRRAVSCVLWFTAVCALGATSGKEPAPHFSARTIEGEKFSNESIRGKIVLLAINVGESKKTVKKYLDAHPRNCKIVLMEDTNLAAMYQATVYPIYVVIDREGNIAATQRGAGGEPALRRLIARAGLDSPDSPDDSDSD